MRVRVGEIVRRGRALDLHAVSEFCEMSLSPVAVAKFVRSDPVEHSTELDYSLTVECSDPGPAHEHVGVIGTTTTVSRRPALAAGARSQGYTPPQADELASVCERLDALDPPVVDLRHARKRVADASDAEAEWRERVATLQGRVQALRDAEAYFGDADFRAADFGDADLEEAETELNEATRRLSEVETERIAAEQALSRAREKARESRATRRERLRLEDRASNLRRAAREHLAECMADSFEDARESVPNTNLSAGVADALALARASDLDAPVVLDRCTDPFETPEAAAEWLDAPVLHV